MILGPDDIRPLLPDETARFTDDDTLQEIINAEESWLARLVGPLVGERSETFTPDSDDVVYLRRPADAVEVTDDGVTTLVTLRNDGRSFTRLADYWLGDVVATYVPNDETEVRRVVTELVRLALTETGYTSETIGNYTYDNDHDGFRNRAARRNGLWRSLLPVRAASSSRIRSSVLE